MVYMVIWFKVPLSVTLSEFWRFELISVPEYKPSRSKQTALGFVFVYPAKTSQLGTTEPHWMVWGP